MCEKNPDTETQTRQKEHEVFVYIYRQLTIKTEALFTLSTKAQGLLLRSTGTLLQDTAIIDSHQYYEHGAIKIKAKAHMICE